MGHQRNIISGFVGAISQRYYATSLGDRRIRSWRRGASGGDGGGGPVEDNGLGGWGSDVESARDSFVWICVCAIGAGGDYRIVNK